MEGWKSEYRSTIKNCFQEMKFLVDQILVEGESRQNPNNWKTNIDNTLQSINYYELIKS